MGEENQEQQVNVKRLEFKNAGIMKAKGCDGDYYIIPEEGWCSGGIYWRLVHDDRACSPGLVGALKCCNGMNNYCNDNDPLVVENWANMVNKNIVSGKVRDANKLLKDAEPYVGKD